MIAVDSIEVGSRVQMGNSKYLIGTVINIYTIKGKTTYQVRWDNAGTGYCTQEDLTVI